MKIITKAFLAVTTLSIGLGIGTIALYANNDGFKGFLDGMVEKHAGSGHTSEYMVADAASSDYVSDYSENQIVHNDMESNYADSESNSYNADLPGDYREQAYDDTYGYDYYADDVTTDKETAHDETSEPELSSIQNQEVADIQDEDTSTTEEKQVVVKTDNRFTGDPAVREMFLTYDHIDKESGLWTPDGRFTYEQLVVINSVPWAEAGYTSLAEAWADFYCTQWAYSVKTGHDDFYQWCVDIVNGVDSKYDNYMTYDPSTYMPGIEWKRY